MYINSVKAIDCIIEDEKERETSKAVVDIINHMKAFYCDVFGSFVYNWRVLGNFKLEPISFRIDVSFLPLFLNVLSMTYTIHDEVSGMIGEYPITWMYTLTHKQNPKLINPIKLRVLVISKKNFRSYPVDFDINLLAEDDACVYVRSMPKSTRYILDKITHVKERICEKKFCVVEHLHNCRVSKDIANVIEHAVHLLNSGWVMDDNLLNESGWVLTKWENLLRNPNKIRTSFSSDNILRMKSCDECCLCQEKFKESDIVINTPCNHNHHWVCPQSENENNGLKCWVRDQNKTCCPCCRAEMF